MTPTEQAVVNYVQNQDAIATMTVAMREDPCTLVVDGEPCWQRQPPPVDKCPACLRNVDRAAGRSAMRRRKPGLSRAMHQAARALTHQDPKTQAPLPMDVVPPLQEYASPFDGQVRVLPPVVPVPVRAPRRMDHVEVWA